jgi:hypothetical protein
MTKRDTKWMWMLWLVSSLTLGGYLGFGLLAAEDKSLFMPGPLSNGHHQLTQSCGSCHTDAFGGGEVLQEACLKCHGEERVKPVDSHPLAKFKDPRNADRLKHIDALKCVTCHTEHRPEITRKDGLTQPLDVCFYCHQEVAKNRPSHQGMAFDTCKNSGCHNYHNNRALYTDFLIKHLHGSEVNDEPLLPEREFAARLDEVADYPREQYPLRTLSIADMDAPLVKSTSLDIRRDWLETAHARAGVNCTACHVLVTEAGADPWQDKPGKAACARCHAVEVKRFGLGKHGMREAVDLAPMTPADARLPMQQKAAHKELTCSSCHGGHRFDVRKAAVDACLGCHADEHSLAYIQSKHFQLWIREMRGDGAPNSGVTCAGCHMPRIKYEVSDYTKRIMVDHNQSADLSPNSKMLRPACLNCHGLGFSLDALADVALIQRNFTGKPTVHVQSMELAEADQQRRAAKAAEDDDAGMFGF